MSKTPARVLVADDDRDTADKTADLLRVEGYTVRAVYDGLQALEAAHGFDPHAVILDIDMPVMDGYAAATAIRRQCAGKRVVLIAHTASVPTAVGVIDSRLAAFDHYLAKPAASGQLCALVGTALAPVVGCNQTNTKDLTVQASESGQARFAAVVEALRSEPGVSHTGPGSKTFGHEALKVHDKIFAMVSAAGNFVVKLPKARVDALEAERAGNRFEARGKPMKEWLQVDSSSDLVWLPLAREALAFVRSLP